MKQLQNITRLNNRQKGYTLIELLVVMMIFITIGGVVLAVIYISFRGSTKTQVGTTVKQNGSFAMTQMVKTIRFAKGLNDPVSCVPSANVNSITVTTLEYGGQTTFSCPTETNPSISSNSASLIDTNKIEVKDCSFTCKQLYQTQPPTITIEFTLRAKNAGGLTEAESEIPFQSSVLMRNTVGNN